MYAENKTWSTVMRLLRTEGEFRFEDLNIIASERHETRITLRYMRNEGWICSCSAWSSVMYPGPTYNELFGSNSSTDA
jgi:hypothetical protein